MNSRLLSASFPVHWMDALPIILLTVRATDKENMWLYNQFVPVPSLSFILALCHTMVNLRPNAAQHIPNTLQEA